LQSTPQENVTTQDQTIAIEPADPEVVYLPEYDPWLVYGAPIGFYPGWVAAPGFFFDGPGIDFGVGIGIGVFGGFGWGWHHWDADWHHHFVDFDHHHFVSHSLTFGHFRPAGGAGAFRGTGSVTHVGGFRGNGFAPGGGGQRGASLGAMHSSAFSGFNHGGIAKAYSARGASSVAASHEGFQGGGFHGGGFHGGGGGHR
jgi:hypothetical protein